MKRLFIVLKELGEAFPCGVVFFFLEKPILEEIIYNFERIRWSFSLWFCFFFFLDKPILDGFTHLFK